MQAWDPTPEIPSQQRLPKPAAAFPRRRQRVPRPRLAAPHLLSLSSTAAHRRARERGSASQLCLSWPPPDWLRQTWAGVGLAACVPRHWLSGNPPPPQVRRACVSASRDTRAGAPPTLSSPPSHPLRVAERASALARPLPLPQLLSAQNHLVWGDGKIGLAAASVSALGRALTSSPRGGSSELDLNPCDCRLLLLPAFYEGFRALHLPPLDVLPLLSSLVEGASD